MTNSFKDHEFVTQYAIRMPDGKLYGSRSYTPAQQIQEMFGGGFGMVFGGSMPWEFEGDEDEEIITPPTVWYDRKEAERCLLQLQTQMATLGIGYWGGVIVERLCSPFTAHTTADVAQEVQDWLREQ